MEEIGQKLIYKKRYIIEKSIKKGGQGEVFLITDIIQKNKKKVLKILKINSQDDRSRILTEPKLVTTLNHQNIIKAENFYFQKTVNQFDRNYVEQQLFIILEYIEGGELTDFLGKLLLDDIKQIYMQLRRGLQYLHQKNIIHRDIALKNVLLDKNKNIKIIDFGISSQLNHKQATFTKFGIGTQFYKPPELLSNKIKTTKGDLWAVGIMLLQLLLGKHLEEILEEEPGNDKTFPEKIFYKYKQILGQFLPVLRSLLMLDYKKRQFLDLPSKSNGIEAVLSKSNIDQNKIILQDDYIIYHPNAQIIEGQSSIIYFGESIKRQSQIAIKNFIKTKASVQLSNVVEIILQKIFYHKNIIRIFDLIADGNQIYLITEFCAKKDLKRYFRQHQKFTELQVLNLLEQLVGALAEMNRKFYIHRNINPSHIFLKQNGQSRISGISFIIKVFGENIKDAQEYDFPDLHKADLCYTAPQILKKEKYSGLCDSWSLGCVIYECLTGQKLFVKNNLEELISQQKSVIDKILEINQYYHPFMIRVLFNLLGQKQMNRNSCIQIQQYLKTWKESVTSELKILKYIEFLYNKGQLLIKCADLLRKQFSKYPLQDLKKYTLIYLIYGRFLLMVQKLENLLNINQNLIIVLPNDEDIIIQKLNFMQGAQQRFKSKIQYIRIKLKNQKKRVYDIMFLISKQIPNEMKIHQSMSGEYQYLYQVIIFNTPKQQQIQQNYDFFKDNYKLFLLNECKIQQLHWITQQNLRIYYRCLKIMNIQNTINQQKYLTHQQINDFQQLFESDNRANIIKNIKKIQRQGQ